MALSETITRFSERTGRITDPGALTTDLPLRLAPRSYPNPKGPSMATVRVWLRTSRDTELLEFAVGLPPCLRSHNPEHFFGWVARMNRTLTVGSIRLLRVRRSDGVLEFQGSVRYSVPAQTVDEETFQSAVTSLLGTWQIAIGELNRLAREAILKERVELEATCTEKQPPAAQPTGQPVSSAGSKLASTVLDDLNRLVGLAPVKKMVCQLVARREVANQRRELGMKEVVPSPHLVFTGNPGTGKTTVARLVGRLYKSLGLLSSGHVVETDRSSLVAGYIGQTALRTLAACEKARGGVLFIDEAYGLAVDGRDFGSEAIETLLAFMENNRSNFAVVVAGYPAEMTRFIDSNPGLKSRFDVTLDFPDYSSGELVEIFGRLVRENDYELTPKAFDQLMHVIRLLPRGHGFGNAREIRRLFNNTVINHAESLIGVENPTPKQLRTIERSHLPRPAMVQAPQGETPAPTPTLWNGYL